MNDRIKELLARPELERLNDWASIGPVQRAALETFAELIVLECCEVADTLHLYLPPMTAKKLIARHFGVEP